MLRGEKACGVGVSQLYLWRVWEIEHNAGAISTTEEQNRAGRKWNISLMGRDKNRSQKTPENKTKYCVYLEQKLCMQNVEFSLSGMELLSACQLYVFVYILM